MKMKIFITVVFLSVAAVWTFGEALTVDYFDGVVELKTTKGWSPLSIGDQVASNASIRVSQSGSVEFSLGKQRITILKDGTYAVSDLLKVDQKGPRSGLGIALTQKLHTLTTEKASGTAAGGVRGAQQDNENLVWVDESEETRQKATQLFQSGKYADAIPLLDKAISDATSATSGRSSTTFWLPPTTARGKQRGRIAPFRRRIRLRTSNTTLTSCS